MKAFSLRTLLNVLFSGNVKNFCILAAILSGLNQLVYVAKALFPLSAMVQFGTVWEDFFCYSTVKRVPKGTK